MTGRGRFLADLLQEKSIQQPPQTPSQITESSAPKQQTEELPAQLEIPPLEDPQFEDSKVEDPNYLYSIPCLEEDKEELQTPEKIKVLTNFLRLLRTPGYDVFLYQLKVEPESSNLDSKSIRTLLDSKTLQKHLQTSPFMFGDKFYLPKKLPSFSLFPIAHPSEGESSRQLRVTITFIKALPLREQLVLFNCLFKRIMSLLGYTFMKTKYFAESKALYLEAWMMQLWPGFAIDVLADGQGELLLCVDISHRILHRTSVLDQMNMLVGGGSLTQNRALLGKHFVGGSVLARYSKQTYRVDDIDFEASPRSLFEAGSSGKRKFVTTFVDYYREKWGLEIRELDQPLLVHQKKSQKTGEVRNLYLVPELCNTTGLGLVPDQTAFQKVISTVQPPPNARYRSLMRYIELIKENPEASRLLADWGLALEPYTSLSLTGDRLPEEMIVMGKESGKSGPNSNSLARHRFYQSSKTTPSNWAHLLRHSPLLVPVSIGAHWSVVHAPSDTASVKNFIILCRRYAPAMSILLEEPRSVVVDRNSGETFGPSGSSSNTTDDFLLAIKNSYRPEDKILVVVTPGFTEVNERYDRIKQLCTIQLGLPTQFVRGSTLSMARKLETITPSILVQMACKLGGAPWGVSMPKSVLEPNLSLQDSALSYATYVGIDIYHRKSLKRKSVVGFVASTNAQATSWYSRAFVKAEDTSDLVEGEFLLEAMTSALVRFRFLNRRLPSAVIIYRDDVGVPLERLIRLEYDALVKAVKGVYGSQEENPESISLPIIVFMTVAKRISTKLFVKDEDEDLNLSKGISNKESTQPESTCLPRVKNPPSGTVLTMNAERFDQFFLVSQKSTVTAACPVRIRVLRNSGCRRIGCGQVSGSSFEDTPKDLLDLRTLQSISYKLCYLYYNSTSICRQPAPGMYAHKVANFVGEHLETEGAEELHGQLFYL